MSKRVRHENTGNCLKCEEILTEYPGFYAPLKEWFKSLQRQHPDAHVSDAGRGRDEQERYKQRGASRASFGQSSHNYNCAIDIFQLAEVDGKHRAMWPKKWFQTVVGNNLTSDLKWYGSPGSSFYELPHVEVKDWKGLARQGVVSLVEEPVQGDKAIVAQPSKPVVMPQGRQNEEYKPSSLETGVQATMGILNIITSLIRQISSLLSR